jgi:hypothetical protein
VSRSARVGTGRDRILQNGCEPLRCQIPGEPSRPCTRPCGQDGVLLYRPQGRSSKASRATVFGQVPGHSVLNGVFDARDGVTDRGRSH